MMPKLLLYPLICVWQLTHHAVHSLCSFPAGATPAIWPMTLFRSRSPLSMQVHVQAEQLSLRACSWFLQLAARDKPGHLADDAPVGAAARDAQAAGGAPLQRGRGTSDALPAAAAGTAFSKAPKNRAKCCEQHIYRPCRW